MALRRTTPIVLSTGMECQGKAPITNKFNHKIIWLAVEVVMKKSKLNYTITPGYTNPFGTAHKSDRVWYGETGVTPYAGFPPVHSR